MSQELSRNQAITYLNNLAAQWKVPNPQARFNCEKHCSGPKVANKIYQCGMATCCNESLGNHISFKSNTKLETWVTAHEFGHYLFHVKNPGTCQAYIEKHGSTHPECDALAEKLGSPPITPPEPEPAPLNLLDLLPMPPPYPPLPRLLFQTKH